MEQQLMTAMGWVLSPVCAALVTALAAEKRRAKEKEAADDEQRRKRDAAMEKGMAALLRQKLIDIHREYVASGKPCPARIKEQATDVHDAYTSLGYNSTGTHLWQEIMDAPVEK